MLSKDPLLWLKGNCKFAMSPEYTMEAKASIDEDEDEELTVDYIQWMSSNNKIFFPASKNVKRLVPGFYEIGKTMDGQTFFSRIRLNTEELIHFPDTNCDEVVKEIETFWEREGSFRDAGLTFKRGILMYGPPGCHAKGSRIIMHDGSTKPVEEIEVGDLLMGPDSRSRRVFELRRGRDEMYRITPKKGPSFIVNQHHILSLKYSGTKDRYPSPVNVQLKDYLGLGQPARERLKLSHPGVVQFNYGPSIPIDPYFLGVWLGDGTAREPAVTSADFEIADYIKDYANSLGLKVSTYRLRNNLASTYRLSKTSGCSNRLFDAMRDLNLISNKHIPECYRTASDQTRLTLLAGIVDTDGTYSAVAARPNDKRDKTGYKGYYDIIQVNERLTEDVLWIARSLGFGTNVKKCKKSIKSTGFEGEYFRISIFGDISRIPVKLARKQASAGKANKNPLLTGIRSIEHIGRDEFFGFTLSGDHLYLTDDFIVHHNSGKTCTIKMILNNIIKRGGIAIKFDSPRLFTAGMKVLREIQSKTPVICMMEDIDSILYENSESSVINVIDGMEGMDRIVFLATTNYPEKLGSRIMNRPSRFDKRIFVGMPSAESREIYLTKKLKGQDVPGGMKKWVSDTENFSIAHMKELIVAVTILDKEYDEALAELRQMADKVDSKTWDNFGEGDAFASDIENSIKTIDSDTNVPDETKFAAVVKVADKDKLKGGLGDKSDVKDEPYDQLGKGVKVEMEHTDDPGLSSEIAKDHLEEDPKYYDELEKMEDESKTRKSKEAWLVGNCKFATEHKKAKEGKPVNPWAVCHTTVDKDDDPEKYERCVKDVKKKHPVRKDTPKK